MAEKPEKSKPTSHDLHGLSNSALSLISRSPAHYHWRYILGNKEPPSKALIDGRCIDVMTLEPEKFDDKFFILPPEAKGNSKAAREIKADLIEANTGKDMITQDQYDMAVGCANAVRNHGLVKTMLADPNGKAQYKIKWTDAETGVLMQGYIDWITGAGIAFDLKSTDDARPAEFAKSIGKFRYDVQAALYIDGARAMGIDINHFYFVAVEKKPPHCVSVIALDPADLETGRMHYQHDLFVYQACKKNNRWPGYQEKIFLVNTPPWALKQRELRTGE